MIVFGGLLVPDEHDVENLCRHTLRSLVIFQRQRDLVGIVTIEETLVQTDLTSRATIKDVLSQLVESFKHSHFHSLANCVLPLDVRQGFTAYCEVFRDHTEIVIPAFEVANILSVQLLEREGRNVISQLVLGKDFCWCFGGIVLIFDHSDDHAAKNEISLTAVRVGM